ncbi:MAG: hypothetical protein JJT96_08700 [Opitutales bacterium]|nr:hypothetical protein [Opitutales bacterium]
MKTFLPASLLALFLGSVAHAASTVYESPTEWFLTGDFNGNGQTDVLVAERATGIFRVGFSEPTGGYSWLPFHPSGIAPIDDAHVGKIIAMGFDTVAFAGRETNRINLFRFQGGTIAQPVTAFTTGVGPGFVASSADSIITPRELLVGIAVEGGVDAPSQPESFLTGSPHFPAQWTSDFPETTRAFGSLAFERGSSRLGYWMTSMGDAANSWAVRGLTLTMGEANLSAPEPVPDESRLAAGNFFAEDDAGALLVYQPGNAGTSLLVAELSGMEMFFFSADGFSAVFPIGVVQTLPDPDGQDMLLVVDETFERAMVYRIDALGSFSRLEELGPSSGFITGVAPDNAGGFTLFSGPSPQGPSDTYTQYGFDGTDFSVIGNGSFPAWPAPERLPASLVLFEGEALVDDDARVRGRLFAGEWTRSAEATPGISAEAERFRSEALGLGDPETLSLGSPPPNVDYALANQFLPNVSFASLGGPIGFGGDATLEPEPLPGSFRTSIAVSFPEAHPHVTGGLRVLYRTDSAAGWTEYTGAFWLYKDSTLQWVTVDTSTGTRSPVRSGSYRFPAPPHEMDSDGDGVPDFVKIAAGLDPLGGTGAEGDGLSSLEELLRIGPIDPGSSFDVLAAASPFDVVENRPTIVRSGTPIRAYNASGTFLSAAVADDEDSAFPAVLIEELDIDRARPYFALSTPRNFDIEINLEESRYGRELLALYPRPLIERPVVDYVYGGGSLGQEAEAWRQAAVIAYSGHHRTRVEADLRPVDTLHAALFEATLSALLRARRGDPEEAFTVFPFRSADAARSPIDREQLAELGRGDSTHMPYRALDILHLLRNWLQADDPGAAVLRELAVDVYRSAASGGLEILGRHAMPFEAFRYFLTHGDLPDGYLRFTELSEGQRQFAADTAALWIDDVPARPFASLALEVPADAVSPLCTVLVDPATGTRHALLRANGERFRLPGNLAFSEGTVLFVDGYTDVSSACADAALEVINIALFSFPTPRAGDHDDNLLPDAWERFFLGTTGLDPLASPDGSGFSALQQFLDGTDPTNPADIPSGEPVDFSPPSLRIAREGGSLAIDWDWHPAYADAFRFRVAQSTDLESFVSTSQEGEHTGSGRFEVTLPEPAPGIPVFFRIEMSLR